MKKILLATTLLAAAVAGASAADLPTKAPVVVPASIISWTGIYLGAHIGAGFDSNSHNFVVAGAPFISNKNSSFLGGGQLGADWQFAPNFLIGVEGQISGLVNETRSFTNAAGANFTDRTDWLASVTARAGYVTGPVLFYAKGGIAFRDNGTVSASTAPGFATPFTYSRNTTGFTAGVGTEYMFAPGWSAKVEYQYYNFDRSSIIVPAVAALAAPGVSYRDDLHTIKLGVNYHFNWGAPVVVKF